MVNFTLCLRPSWQGCCLSSDTRQPCLLTPVSGSLSLHMKSRSLRHWKEGLRGQGREKEKQTEMQARLLPQRSLEDRGVQLFPSRGLQNLSSWTLNVKEDTASNCDSSNFQRQDQRAQAGSKDWLCTQSQGPCLLPIERSPGRPSPSPLPPPDFGTVLSTVLEPQAITTFQKAVCLEKWLDLYIRSLTGPSCRAT